jgi:hypothetical protein
MTAPSEFDTSPPPATAKPASLWEDFIDIFVSPAEVFERRRNSGFFLPLIVFTILSVVIMWVGRSALQPMIDAEFARGMAAAAKQNPNITPEQMAASGSIMQKFTIVIAGIGAFIMPMVVGLFLWIVGKFFQAKEDIGAACMIAAYAFFPRLLDTLLRVVQAFMMDPSQLNGQYRVTLSAARFLNPDVSSPVIIGLLGRIDLFTIWITILLGIGLSVVARIPRSKAFTAAFLVWVLGSLPALLAALRAS